MKNIKLPYKLCIVTAVSALAFPAVASAFGEVEVVLNGGFEAGDVSNWVSFPSPSSTFGVTTVNPKTGTFAGEVFNDWDASSAVIKQANLAVGLINPGDPISISFDARGAGVDGGVLFAELFSEIAGGGVSSSTLLGGAPLALNADPSVWTNFSFTGTAGADVSGGITLQLAAVTGAVPTSSMSAIIDNVSVTVVPEPSSVAVLFGLSGLALVLVRRRMKSSR